MLTIQTGRQGGAGAENQTQALGRALVAPHLEAAKAAENHGPLPGQGFPSLTVNF